MRCCDRKEQFGLRVCKARTSYPLLYAPSGVYGARVQRGRAIARSSKNIFRSYLSDRISFISFKFDFFRFEKWKRG